MSVEVTAEDFNRQIVCPDTGDAFEHVDDAVRVMRLEGYVGVTASHVFGAIASGDACCGRFWDWRWPKDYSPPPTRRAHGVSRVTPDQVDEIRRRCAGGERLKTIAADFGISKQSVSNIKNGRTHTKNWN